MTSRPLWRRLTADRPIVTRLVITVAAAMAVVLLASLGLVYWRVSYALDRQVDQDLRAYRDVVRRAMESGTPPPTETPGEAFQVYDLRGRFLTGSRKEDERLVPATVVEEAARGTPQRVDRGTVLPPSEEPYRALVERMRTPQGPVVVAAAISRHKHDEALRELILQLVLAGLLTLAAASFVGYRTARGALDPVERYRRAAAAHDQDPTGSRLPVPADRDDELARLGRTFNRLLDRIDAAHERERQFLADASHELRTPLARMRTEIDFALLRDRGAVELREALESLDGQVRRLVELSNALLDLEELRSQSGVDRAPTELRELVARVAGRFADDLDGAGRALVLDVADQPVLVSARWVDLALDNLLRNALRHGEGTVTVRSETHGRMVTLTVQDEGRGFSEGFVSQAFERFSRAQESRSTPGSGLGLALVRAVAEAHGGSAYIHGSAVALTLPEAACPDPPTS